LLWGWVEVVVEVGRGYCGSWLVGKGFLWGFLVEVVRIVVGVGKVF